MQHIIFYVLMNLNMSRVKHTLLVFLHNPYISSSSACLWAHHVQAPYQVVVQSCLAPLFFVEMFAYAQQVALTTH